MQRSHQWCLCMQKRKDFVFDSIPSVCYRIKKGRMRKRWRKKWSWQILSSCVNQQTSSVVQGGAARQHRPSPGRHNKALTFSTSFVCSNFCLCGVRAGGYSQDAPVITENDSCREAEPDTRLHFSLQCGQKSSRPKNRLWLIWFIESVNAGGLVMIFE